MGFLADALSSIPAPTSWAGLSAYAPAYNADQGALGAAAQNWVNVPGIGQVMFTYGPDGRPTSAAMPTPDGGMMDLTPGAGGGITQGYMDATQRGENLRNRDWTNTAAGPAAAILGPMAMVYGAGALSSMVSGATPTTGGLTSAIGGASGGMLAPGVDATAAELYGTATAGQLAGADLAGAGLAGAAGPAIGGAAAGAAGTAGSALSSLAKGGAGLLPSLINAGTGLYGLSQAGKLADQASQAAARADPFGPYRAQFVGPLSNIVNQPNPLLGFTQQYGPQFGAAASTPSPVSGFAGTYAQQLQDLMANPQGKLTSIPGYQAGLEAVQRAGAAQGWTGSGQMMTGLQEYGGQFFQQQLANLMNLTNMGTQARQQDISNLGTLTTLGQGATQQQTQNLTTLVGANLDPARAAQIQLSGLTNAASLTGQAINPLAQGATGLFNAALSYGS